MKALTPAIEISLASPSLNDMPESCRELVAGLISSASHPNPVFCDLLAAHLAEWTAQVRQWSHGELVYESTEPWRTAYHAVLADPGVKEYRSVAWVKTEEYWQEFPGQRALQFNVSFRQSTNSWDPEDR